MMCGKGAKRLLYDAEVAFIAAEGSIFLRGPAAGVTGGSAGGHVTFHVVITTIAACGSARRGLTPPSDRRWPRRKKERHRWEDTKDVGKGGRQPTATVATAALQLHSAVSCIKH